jgi:hypothetical protein
MWQPISATMPAAAARRQIIRQASGWLIGLSDKALPLCTRGSAEQPALAVLDNAGGVDIGAQRLAEGVMARYGVLLAAFLMQADSPSGAAWPEVLDLHLQGRADPREAVGKGGNQRTVAQIPQRRGRN